MKNSLASGSMSSVNASINMKHNSRLEWYLFQLALIIMDLCLIYLAFQFSYNVRFSSGIAFFQVSIIPQVGLYKDFMLVTIPMWLFIFAGMGLYAPRNLLGGIREYSILFNATCIGMLLIVSAGFLVPEGLIIARGWVILAWVFSFLFTVIGRFFLRRLVYRLRKHGFFQSPALIIGVNHEGQLLVEQFFSWKTSGTRLVGYVNENANPELDGKLKWVGRLQDLDHLIEKYRITDIVLTSSALSQDQVLSIFRKYGTMKEINLRMSSGLYEIITTGIKVSEDGFVPLLTINKVRMTGIDMIMKQIMDYIIATAAVIVLSPIFILVAILVKLDSPGPIIYRRKVMGVNGKRFDAFKFRTMQVDGDKIFQNNPELLAEYQQNYKLKNDPRVTRVGKIIRKLSIDELPQLFNVLRNEMSIVGPRMITPDELNKYHQWDINLLTVKPGITGMWQVRGRSDVDYDERVRLDMFYIRNWTAWLDIQLLVQTIPAVLSKRGAY
jgi:exopolysaccharide biosynthesis polyprenyl glycosylphosphotransferase